MLLEALIYFSNYKLIVQVSTNVKELLVEVNYSADMLLYFLYNDLHLNICKLWVNYLDDKSLLQPYLLKYSRDSEWIKLLLTFYPEVNYRHRINELLILYCKPGHIELVKWFIDNGADIKIEKYEPFRFACQYGHLEIAKYLLDLLDTDKKKKSCIHSANDYALIWSARYGRLEVVKWLVNNGANIRAGDYRPFQYACQEGHLEIAKYLLSSINTDEEKKLCVQSDDKYALVRSINKGHLNIVKWLVNNGVDVKVNDYQYFRYACKRGHLEIAKYLLALTEDEKRERICVISNDVCILKWSILVGMLK